MSRPDQPKVTLALRLVLALVFVSTAAMKLVEDKSRVRELHSLRLSDTMLVLVAALEIAIAAAIVSPRWVWGVRAAFLFGASAALYLIVLRAFAYDLTICGCFGSKRVGVGAHFAILFGVMLVSLSILGSRSRSSPPT